LGIGFECLGTVGIGVLQKHAAMIATRAGRPVVITRSKDRGEDLSGYWGPFKALRQRYANTRFDEQRQLHLPRR
jgi:hypothetical protein